MDCMVEKINKILPLCKKAKFYKDKNIPENISSIEEFNDLPTIGKSELRDKKPADLLSVDLKDVYLYCESFGTTGTPISTWLTKSDFDNYVSQINESEVNFNSDDVALIRFPYELSTPAHIFEKAIQKRGGAVVAASRTSVVTPPARVLNLLKKLPITILAANPSEIIQLGHLAVFTGAMKEIKKLRAICLAGEMLSRERQKRIENLWGVPVFNFFGTTETGNLATTCRKNKFHCSDNHFIFEVLDPMTHNPVKSGNKGNLYVTTLSKTGFPLIRYSTGDVVQLLEKTCACGNEGKILVHHGREDDVITIGGASNTMLEIQNQILKLPPQIIGDFWEIRCFRDKIKILAESDTYGKNINKKYFSELNLNILYEIELLPTGSIVNMESLLKIEKVGKPLHIKRF